MSVLPRRARLALAACLEVALFARGQSLSAKALNERLMLQPRTLEMVLQELVTAGILKGTRGPKGGYELAKERRRISVADIVKAALFNDADETTSMAENIANNALQMAEDHCFAALAAITLDELCEKAKVEQPKDIDFTI